MICNIYLPNFVLHFKKKYAKWQGMEKNMKKNYLANEVKLLRYEVKLLLVKTGCDRPGLKSLLSRELREHYQTIGVALSNDGRCTAKIYNVLRAIQEYVTNNYKPI